MDGNAVLLGLCISVVVVGVGVITNPLPSADIQTCPLSFANDTRDAFGLFNKSAYVQLGLTHRIPCLAYSYRENETLFLYWSKLKQSIDGGDSTREQLVTYKDKQEFPESDRSRYSLASDFGLLIKGIEEIDAGEYRCDVYWEYGTKYKNKEEIYIQVIGHTLPHGSEAVNEGSPTSHLERGRRHTLPCGCASQTPDTQDSVVYWSTGEGVTTDTQIIGARFSDGATLQIQHGADYSIGINASLTINSLYDVQRTQRFWCHVFQSNDTLHSCSTDVQNLPDQNPSFVLTASPTEFYLPEGFQQVLPCRSWTPGDVMCEVQWIHEPNQRVVVSYNLSADTMEADSDYDLSSDFGLRIKSINHTHGGRYTCNLIDGSGNTLSKGAIDTHVIGRTFPTRSGVISETSTLTSIERWRRHILLCGCATQTQDAPSAVYWSMGEGNTTDTQIIGARFSNGTTLQIQHGADYSIGIDASLTINSLNDVQDTQRFWCHVFQSNGTLHSCSTDVQIQDQNPNIVLKTSPTEFYLPEGYQQVLPCRSWKPGDMMREVQWIREPSRRVILSYNLFADSVIADLDYDLASNFGLLIKSVNHTHAGRYTCYIFYGPGKAPLKAALDTHVIGDSFPASPYNMSSSITVMQGQGMTLPCECAQQSADASILAVYWSKGEGNSSDTDVIAGCLANGSVLNSRSNGHNISSNWSLTVSPLRNSSFSCHVFRSDGTLANCHTNVWIMQEAGEPKGSNQGTANLRLLALVVIPVAVFAVVLLCLRYRKEWLSTSSCQMGEWPETDKQTYTHPELFHNTPQGRLRLNEKQHRDFFIDSSNEKCHVLLQGKSGSGKTTFLYKLRHDLQNWKARYCLFWPRTVILTKAVHIRQAVRIIKLHISYFLHLSDAVILVDDCNGVNDIEEVLEATKDLSRCQLVMTTRSEKLARDMSQERGWRHVTITGFSASSSQKYVKSKLEVDCKYSYTETQVQVLLQYLGEHILFESVAYLPRFLNRLCEHHDLELHSSVSDVVSFLCKPGTQNSSANHGNADRLTEKQKEILASEMALPGICKHLENVKEVSQMDVLQSCNSNGEVHHSQDKRDVIVNIFEEESSSQLVSDFDDSAGEGSGQQLPNIENSSAEESSPQASSIENSSVQDSSTHKVLDGNSTESSPLISCHVGDDSEAKFPLEIIRDFYAGKKMAQDAHNWIDKININNIGNLTNVLVFAGAENFNAASTIVDCLIEISRTYRRSIGRPTCNLSDEIQLQKLTEIYLEANFNGRWEGNFNNKMYSFFHEGQLRFLGLSCHRLRLLAYCLKNTSKLKSVQLFCIDQKLSWAEFKQYVEYLYPDILDYGGIEQGTTNPTEEAATACLPKESQESQNCKSVLHALQSMCLEELVDAQSGDECHSSTSARDFTRYLLDQEHLEKIGLLGPVIGSQHIRDLVHYLHKLKNVTQFDLRLNTQMDDRAFKKTMTKLSACKALTDFRLSLYKVTRKGFKEVKDEMKKDATLLKRLETVYLLHGSLPEHFGEFLIDIIGHMDNLRLFHVSALVASDKERGIPDRVVKEIKQQKPTLEELFVDGKNRAQPEEAQTKEGASTSTPSTSGQSCNDIMDTQL